MDQNVFNYDEFYHNANESFLRDDHCQRYGQFLMNYLSEHHSEVLKELPPECDCFYENSRIPNLLNFLAYLYQN